jgi:hypothetical protein
MVQIREESWLPSDVSVERREEREEEGERGSVS